MPTRTPRKVQEWALRILYVTGPLGGFLIAAWGALPASSDGRAPNVLFGLGFMLVNVAVNAAVVAALSHGQVATAKAFTAGYNTGLAIAEQVRPDGGGDGPKTLPLRLVE